MKGVGSLVSQALCRPFVHSMVSLSAEVWGTEGLLLLGVASCASLCGPKP